MSDESGHARRVAEQLAMYEDEADEDGETDKPKEPDE